MNKHVVIVGCGVIGAACAYYLTRAGCRVTMIDQGSFGRGASHGNCGFVCPSHVLPLAGPGAVGRTIKAMLASDSPFSVRPGLNLALWGWLLKFARRCNERHMLAAAQAIHALLQSSRQLYDDLFATEKLEAEWQKKGLFFVFLTKEAMDHYTYTDELLRNSFGVGAVRYDGDAVNVFEPALKTGLAGGWHYPGDAHLRPDRLMASWRMWLTEHGVTIQEGCKCDGFIAEGKQLRAVKTTQGEVEGSHFVIAAGAWTPLLNKELQVKVPIQPGKGYSLTMRQPEPCPQTPLIFEEHRVAVTPFANGYRLGSIMEFAGYDASLDPKRIDLLRRGASHYLQKPCGDEVLEEWWGWRPMTYDSVPIIGPVPAFGNVFLATGHSMLGLSMATGTGKLVREMILGEKPHVDPMPYAVTRF
jgi:D-amino-acid dehydrogenase